MCGIVGLSVPKDTSILNPDPIRKALIDLRLRGTSSAGAVVFLDGETKVFKTEGEPATLEEFSFTHGVALGHVRYATVQLNGDGIQPIKGEHNGQEFFVAHNGEISNFNHLLGVHGFYDLPSDSALIAKLISSKSHLDFEEALLESLKELEGAYSLVIQIGETLYVSRDRAGMRPCVLAKTEDGLFIASESHVFDDILGGPYDLDQIARGETVKIEFGKITKRFKDPREELNEAFCSFEGIYMMRNRARYGAGTVKGFRERLGEKIASRIEVPSGCLVVGVPNSGIPFADGLARELRVEPTPLLLSKSQYQRSFQASTDEERKLRISDKLFINPDLLDSVADRDLVVIDDSIVRGNTSRAFVKMLRELNPKSIILISGYPPVINPCYFGVDLKKPEDFLLRIFLRTTKQIDMNDLAQYIGVDRLHFMSVEDLAAVDQEFRGEDAKLCFGCIDGQYPYPVDAEIEILQRASS